MASPNWKGTRGLEQACETEFRRIFDTLETLEYVPHSEIDKPIAKSGADRVHTLCIAAPFKEKLDSNGKLLKTTMHITVEQAKAHSLGENGFSAVTSPCIVRSLTNWALQLAGATFETWDVSRACYYGEIQSAEENGVVYFAHIPPGWDHFGYGRMCANTGDQSTKFKCRTNNRKFNRFTSWKAIGALR
jgi:hypothetical protein